MITALVYASLTESRVTWWCFFFRLGGYESGACEQSEDVGLALRLLVVPGPVVFVLLALLLLWAYPINEARRAYNMDRLEKIRQLYTVHQVSFACSNLAIMLLTKCHSHALKYRPDSRVVSIRGSNPLRPHCLGVEMKKIIS